MIRCFSAVILLFYFCSCKKETPISQFKSIEYQPVFLGNSILSHGGNELKIKLNFVSLDSNFVEYPSLQGNVNQSDIQITSPKYDGYNFSVDNFQVNTTPKAQNYSAVILFDKTKGQYNFDECISYWIKNLKETNEVAFGGFSDSFVEEGYKIYADGFVNATSEQKFDGLFDAYSDPLNGNANPIQAAFNALDYLAENGINENKNLIVFAFESVDDDDPILFDLIQKAKTLNVKISILGPHNYDFTEVAQKTGGFHCHLDGSPRMLAYSIDKLLNQEYYTSSVEVTITNLVGGSFNTVPQFGYFLSLKTASNDISKRLYYHVFD